MRPAAVVACHVALVALGAGSLRAQPLIPVREAAARLADPATVVVHVAMDRAEYDAGHLPGARFLPFAAYAGNVTSPDTLRTELPPTDSLVRLLRGAGIGDGARLLVVGQPIPSARFFFTLAYLGLDGRASVLDGGMDAWREAGQPVSREAVAAASATALAVSPRPDLLASAADVRAIVADGRGGRLLDARLPEFHLGLAANGFPRAGRIPGAASLPFTTLTRELGQLRPVATLDALLTAAGAARGTSVVTYCHVGQQASLLWFAARLAGREARLYDGSFQEWSRLAGAPVDGPASRP